MADTVRTLRDLAKRLDVSLATVSRALSRDAQIAPGPRQRIAEAARRHADVPKRAAWARLAGQSGCLNSMLPGLGIVDRPILFPSYGKPAIIFIAMALAEIWRATAILMVIIVAGMGLIPQQDTEAAAINRRVSRCAERMRIGQRLTR